jgi:hypothetical protein
MQADHGSPLAPPRPLALLQELGATAGASLSAEGAPPLGCHMALEEDKCGEEKEIREREKSEIYCTKKL